VILKDSEYKKDDIYHQDSVVLLLF